MIGKKIDRRMAMLVTAATLTIGAQAAHAGVGVNVNVNLGAPPPAVVVAPEPVYAPAPAPVYAPPPAPVYAPAPVVIAPDVQFIYPERLGFYVAVGVPYDLIYLGNSYFVFRDGRWFRGASYRGPWVEQRHRDLPPMLRRHRLERIREHRDREYVVYRRDADHYRGRHFRADREWKEHRRELKEQRKEEREFAKEQRKEDKRWEKEQRREEKRFEKEERREHHGGHRD